MELYEFVNCDYLLFFRCYLSCDGKSLLELFIFFFFDDDLNFQSDFFLSEI